MSDPPPQCLVWLPLMHRLANVENGKTAWNIYGGERCGEPPEDVASKHGQQIRSTQEIARVRPPTGARQSVFNDVHARAHALSDGRHVNGRVAVTCHVLGFDLCDDHLNRRLK